MTEFGYKHKTYRPLNLFIIYVITTDPANVEYILKKNFANYGKVIRLKQEGYVIRKSQNSLIFFFTCTFEERMLA